MILCSNHKTCTLQWTGISNTQTAVYVSDTPAALGHGQSHQTWYQLVGPKQGYNHAKFERPPLHMIQGKANFSVFVKSESMSIIFPE